MSTARSIRDCRASPKRNRGRGAARASVYLRLESLEDRVLLSGGDSINPLTFASQVAHDTRELSAASDVRIYDIPIVLTHAGNISAKVDANGAPISLTLLDAQGVPIVQSNGESPADLGPRIVQGLSAGDAGTHYLLEVKNLESTLGNSHLPYLLTTDFTPSDSNLQVTPVVGARVLAEGDFNGDGKLDQAVGGPTGITILLGNGDGTFRALAPIPLAVTPQTLVAGHFHGDLQPLDLAFTSYLAQDVTILQGQGDGTFPTSTTVGDLANPVSGNSLVAAEFDGDHHLDLAVANSLTNQVFILSGHGDGGFSVAAPLSVPGTPVALVAGDFTGSGWSDLVSADRDANTVTLLKNQAGAGFSNAGSFAVGVAPVTLAAVALNHDGPMLLAVADLQSKDVRTLQWDGSQAAFSLLHTIALKNNPGSLVAFPDGAGRMDLATADPFADDLTVLKNEGGGAFTVSGSAATAANPSALIAGDFNGDGNIDLASANSYADNVTTLLGRGDGFFPETGSANGTGHHPQALVQGDFNGDGRLDVATANYDDGTVSILLAREDGTFQNAATINVGFDPVALVAGDFNRDGRLDLATANPSGENVTILLGNGDGTFVLGNSFSVAGQPSSIVARDFDQTGVLDLAVTIRISDSGDFGNQVALLPGDGHGAFGAPRYFTVGVVPEGLVAGDFSGDGRLDLAVASYSYNSQNVTVLIGKGGNLSDGTFDFLPAVFYTVAGAPVALVAGDFEGNHQLDLAVADLPDPNADTAVTLTVLHNDGRGAFTSTAADAYTLPATSATLVAGDFNGDGRVDLATANYLTVPGSDSANSITVLLAKEGGQFDNHVTIPLKGPVGGLTSGDFNGDGRLDLAVTDTNAATVTDLLGNGAGDFVPPTWAPGPMQATPLVTPFTGVLDDAVVLTEAGQILLRRGLIDPPGSFAPPVVLNADPTRAARAVAVVKTTSGSFLAALESGNSRVTLYQADANGNVSSLPPLDLPAGAFPSNIASADLNGDGLGDLVITASRQLFIALQTSPGVFGPFQVDSILGLHSSPLDFNGNNPSAIEFSDVNGDSRTDIVVSDRFSGQVFLLLNQGDGVFGPAQRYRAGTGLYELTPINGTANVQSLETTDGVFVGNFDSRPGLDCLTLNAATRTVSLLSGDGHGGFLNPQTAITLTAGTPSAIVAGDFDSDGNLDVAILSTDTGDLSVFRGDGQGHFSLAFSIKVGNQPTGLSVANVTRPGGGRPDLPGIPDLLVGNALGDLLILAGNGDGTFSAYQRADQKTSLAIAPALGQTPNLFYFSDHAGDQLAYSSALPGAPLVAGPTVFQDRSLGIQAPGEEALVTVQGVQYLAVLNSGSNQLLIFTIDKNGLPIPASKQVYFTGTNPVGLTVTHASNDLNGDSIPDVAVANEGSNDVSIFIGAVTERGWVLTSRPRTGGGLAGPTSIAIADVTGVGQADALPDLLVSNAQTNEVRVLANRGDGFFAADAHVFATGARPQQILVGNFDTNPGLDLVTINAGSNDVTLISNFLTAPVVSTISSGGTLPEAAVAVEFNGVTSLVVANAGNGMLEVLTGTSQGFEITALYGVREAPHISDLSLVAAGNGLELYGSVTGRDVAVLLGTFGVDVTPPAALPASPGFPGGVVIASFEIPQGPAIVDASLVFSFPVGATVDVAFNNPVVNRGVFAETSVISDSADSGMATWLDISESPSRILLRNITDSMPRNRAPRGVPEEEEQSDEFSPAWLLQEPVGASACEPCSSASPDVTVALIPLHVAVGPRWTYPTIELNPASRSERNRSDAVTDRPAPSSAASRTEEPAVKKAVWDLLGVGAMVPIVFSRLLENLRPGWRRLQTLLRKVRSPGEPEA